MDNSHMPDADTIRTAVSLAVRAPSVHNTQPWLWRIGDESINLYADRSLHLRHTDPDQRDLMLSCGAALHHVRIALAALGWRSVVHRFPNPADKDHVAALELHRRQPTQHEIALAAAIPRRRTDRRHYSAWPVPPEYLARLGEAAENEGVVFRVLESQSRFAELIREAVDLHTTDAAYQAELATWSGRHGSPEGVPSQNTPLAEVTAEGISARRFAWPALSPAPGTDAASDEAEIIMLTTASDDVLSRLRSGEASSAVMLEATALGLASCPITEPLEVRATREAVQNDVLHDTGVPQIAVRVGWAHINADPLPPTPRRAVDDFIRPLGA
ncbi:nitroreductase family protein [Hoyosella sp. YIM 151337]|uniref:Acg family FMN-binding oxidoreductase n=1 Tax=Hoyosella sp. YIM 151337 TaxID=2992742 RepID=UPI0022363DAB|nr:nitroreductase family protein [Hoyosella sp. YIM 151337]MCW4352936.1 nitroreductase family protein [Hoyosella sp. YIM 151337]